MSDSQQCPECKKWIPLGVRRRRAAFERHIKTEHPETFKRQEVVRAEFLPDGEKRKTAPPDPRILEALIQDREFREAEYAVATGVRKAQIANALKGINRRIKEMSA